MTGDTIMVPRVPTEEMIEAGVQAICGGCDINHEEAGRAWSAMLEAAPKQVGGYACAAQGQGTSGGNDPADCDWPVCGCDPNASKVIEALQESGLLAYSKQVGGKREAIFNAVCSGLGIAKQRGPFPNVAEHVTDAILAALSPQNTDLARMREALEPFSRAAKEIEAESLFGGLGTSEAGVHYPDETKMAAVHVTPEDEDGNQFVRFCGSDDDIGSFTLGDLRRARAALSQDASK